jgi:hypothetical protein
VDHLGALAKSGKTLGVRSFYKRTRAPEQRRGRNIRKIKGRTMAARGKIKK